MVALFAIPKPISCLLFSNGHHVCYISPQYYKINKLYIAIYLPRMQPRGTIHMLYIRVKQARSLLIRYVFSLHLKIESVRLAMLISSGKALTRLVSHSKRTTFSCFNEALGTIYVSKRCIWMSHQKIKYV